MLDVDLAYYQLQQQNTELKRFANSETKAIDGRISTGNVTPQKIPVSNTFSKGSALCHPITFCQYAAKITSANKGNPKNTKIVIASTFTEHLQ